MKTIPTHLNSRPRIPGQFGASVAVALFGAIFLPSASADSPAARVRLDASDWSAIQQARLEAQLAITPSAPGTFRGNNPNFRWQTEFQSTGPITTPQSGQWQWGLRLLSLGFENSLADLPGEPRLTAEANRLVYQWSPTVYEWFVNRPEGLQQGWTITERPERSAATGDNLELKLVVLGNLQPTVAPDARSVAFTDASGATTINYSGLIAWDADGKPLSVEFARNTDSGLRIRINERTARYPITIDPLAQQAYVKASNTDASDDFGAAVAVSGDTVVVGAPGEDSNATGVNGNQSNEADAQSGAAYVFERLDGVWQQTAYLKANNTGALDLFGGAVAIDGDLIVVGATTEDTTAMDSGAAYVYRRVAGVWEFEEILKASNAGPADYFGTSVAVSGEHIIVGAPGEATSNPGVNPVSNEAANDSGAAYAFNNFGGWNEIAFLKATDNPGPDDDFGRSVAISGELVIVGAPLEDFDGVNGNGAAYTFRRNGVVYTSLGALRASNFGANDEFGTSVAISGSTAVVGAPSEDEIATNSGAAYVFVLDAADNWSQQAFLKPNPIAVGDEFGTSVAISGDALLVGAQFEDGIFGAAGAAYLFRRNGLAWPQTRYIKASNAGFDDRFGFSVGISGNTLVVAANREDSSATGINGNGTLNNAIGSGAAYFYFDSPDPATPAIPAVDTTPPNLAVQGKSLIKTRKSRISIRGTATDASGVNRVEFKAGKGGFKRARLSGTRWKAVARIKKTAKRGVIKIRAIDNVGNVSGVARVKIRRP